MIPAEAVEAAAIVLWDKEMNAPWSSVAEGFKAPFLRDARAALEAAAPQMLREAQEVAWAKGATSAGMNLMALQAAGINPNPYRKATHGNH